MSEATDQQLVDRVLAGEKNAFNLLVLRYQHRVAALVGRFVHDAAEAEDVSQEAFVKAYRALPLFRGDSAFYTWLYRIAVNTAKNHLVSRSRRPRSCRRKKAFVPGSFCVISGQGIGIKTDLGVGTNV
eukprot:TRINITY_DN100923_c0_g1_i1.p4 TRINITY_DN100923_c0_g1~~TRINITY_DN100923_c0_g1_i1.p4  ORF type:complete len:128 (-),score=6.78 TRINITY_DN100923_c0_g1_i1:208-591(-)